MGSPVSTASVLSHRTSVDAGRLREVPSLSHLLSFLIPNVLCLHPKVEEGWGELVGAITEQALQEGT